MEDFVNYLNARGIENFYTRQGNLNFIHPSGRKFQLSRRGWLRSQSGRPDWSGNYRWYIVFKSLGPTTPYDRRQACQFLDNDHNIRTPELIARIEAAGILN